MLPYVLLSCACILHVVSEAASVFSGGAGTAKLFEPHTMLSICALTLACGGWASALAFNVSGTFLRRLLRTALFFVHISIFSAYLLICCAVATSFVDVLDAACFSLLCTFFVFVDALRHRIRRGLLIFLAVLSAATLWKYLVSFHPALPSGGSSPFPQLPALTKRAIYRTVGSQLIASSASSIQAVVGDRLGLRFFVVSQPMLVRMRDYYGSGSTGGSAVGEEDSVAAGSQDPSTLNTITMESVVLAKQAARISKWRVRTVGGAAKISPHSPPSAARRGGSPMASRRASVQRAGEVESGEGGMVRRRVRAFDAACIALSPLYIVVYACELFGLVSMHPAVSWLLFGAVAGASAATMAGNVDAASLSLLRGHVEPWLTLLYGTAASVAGGMWRYGEHANIVQFSTALFLTTVYIAVQDAARFEPRLTRCAACILFFLTNAANAAVITLRGGSGALFEVLRALYSTLTIVSFRGAYNATANLFRSEESKTFILMRRRQLRYPPLGGKGGSSFILDAVSFGVRRG